MLYFVCRWSSLIAESNENCKDHHDTITAWLDAFASASAANSSQPTAGRRNIAQMETRNCRRRRRQINVVHLNLLQAITKDHLLRYEKSLEN